MNVYADAIQPRVVFARIGIGKYLGEGPESLSVSCMLLCLAVIC